MNNPRIPPRAIGLIIVASVFLTGCAEPVTTPAPSTVFPTTTFPPSPQPHPQANITCNELSFYLDPALGSSYECNTVPESSSSDIPMDVFIYPDHTELTIQNYPLAQTQFPPRVWIYPVNRFSELLPDVLPRRVSDLQRLISSATWSSGKLPFLPLLGTESQTFYTHATGMSFNGGQGVRFITEYSDGPLPISNRNILYTFQGLTNDGRVWVAVTLPISSPILPASYDTLPEGYTEESLFQKYDFYVSDVRDSLQAQTPNSFFPTINSLDHLVESITIGQ